MNRLKRLEANFEKDLLQGNINRMFITDNIEELNDRFIFALKNFEKIYTYNHTKLLNKTSKGELDNEY